MSHIKRIILGLSLLFAISGTASAQGMGQGYGPGPTPSYGLYCALTGCTYSGSVTFADGAVHSSTGLTGLASLGVSGLTTLGSGAILSSPAAGTLQFGAGAADTNAAIVAQTLQPQGVSAGGTANQAGKNWTINLSQGKGTGIGGNLIINGFPHGSTGTTLNTAVAALTINGDTLNVSLASTTTSTAYGNGALTLAGGLGVAGPIFTQGSINAGINNFAGAAGALGFTARAIILSPSDGNLQFRNNANNADAAITAGAATFSGGMQLNSPTGGNEGAGTINVSGGYYVNGVLQSGTGKPYFKVRRITSGFTVGSATVVQFNSTVSDTASAWDGTNYRYVPTVAGRWSFTSCLAYTGTSVAGTSLNQLAFFVNGSQLSLAYLFPPSITASDLGSICQTEEATMNGTTDYVDVRATNTATNPAIDFAAYDLSYFAGHYLGPS